MNHQRYESPDTDSAAEVLALLETLGDQLAALRLFGAAALAGPLEQTAGPLAEHGRILCRRVARLEEAAANRNLARLDALTLELCLVEEAGKSLNPKRIRELLNEVWA